MGYYGGSLAYIQALLISQLIPLLAHGNAASALLWRSRASTQSDGEQFPIIGPDSFASQVLRAGAQPPTSYEIALNELQELESEPLCHRIAARLLVTNCQLLEGKDEATVLTDSGRKIRDFVDSYAASLAICDLERGRFAIPPDCAKFQEPTLSQLPIQNAPYLHVTSTEIDGCLSGLGASDSAWNTWVSYRHKALRFCEAARADNDKAQNIILFQRLTKIMSKLADDVDVKIDQRMEDLDLRAQAVEERVKDLSPVLGKLQNELENAENMLTQHLIQGIKRSHDQVNSGLESAAHLERMLQVMLQGVMDGHAEAAAMHDQSLQVMSQRASSEINIMASTMATAVAAAVALRNEVETSRIRAASLESQQDNLELGMRRLIEASDTLTSKYDAHTELLQQAQNITSEILDTLEVTAASAATVGDKILRQRFQTSWWLYIWCPVVSLVMGSYGLPPSLPRNLGLVALGEAAGFIISILPSAPFHNGQKYTPNLSGFSIWPLRATKVSQNLTNLTS